MVTKQQVSVFLASIYECLKQLVLNCFIFFQIETTAPSDT